MAVESKICAGACVLSTYFVSDEFVALTNQPPCFEIHFVLFYHHCKSACCSYCCY